MSHAQSSHGKLIVVEGTDGSGKKTQAKLLIQRLAQEGYRAVLFSFPQYGKKSAGPVEEYLQGVYGGTESVNPYAASLFYAVDRYDASREIRSLIGGGVTVVIDRYVDSNAGHQGGKLDDPKAREELIQWLYHIEYEILRIPRPDVTIILHVPAETGQRLVDLRGGVSGKPKDGHEENLEHLRRAEKAYLWLAARSPQHYRVINCVENGKLFLPAEIHERVWSTVAQMFSVNAPTPSYD